MNLSHIYKIQQSQNILNLHNLVVKKIFWDFPGGAVVKSPPANAGDTGLSPGLGGSHMPRSDWARVPQLLGLCSGAREPQLLSPCAATTETCAPRARALQAPACRN